MKFLRKILKIHDHLPNGFLEFGRCFHFGDTTYNEIVFELRRLSIIFLLSEFCLIFLLRRRGQSTSFFVN